MQQQTVTADFRTLAIDQLRESLTNPRRSFDQDKLQELAHFVAGHNIRKAYVRILSSCRSSHPFGWARRVTEGAVVFSVESRLVRYVQD